MVRNYLRKTNRQSWDESSMLLAIKAVIDDKNSYSKASTNYNVPHSTLQDRVRKIKDGKIEFDRSASKGWYWFSIFLISYIICN